jgi:hypothetical protein
MNKDLAPALAEVMEVLKKHDLVGVVFVGNRTHVDYEIKE